MVDIGDAGGGVEAARDVVDVAAGRQPWADVDELCDVGLLGEVVQRPRQEAAVLLGGTRHVRGCGEDFARRLAVHRVVVFSAQVVVEHPGHVGPLGADTVTWV